MDSYVEWFENLGIGDVERVGGKNASLGEMIHNLRDAGVHVPGGFATTATAYHTFLAHKGLEERIQKELEPLDVDDVQALSRAGERIRGWIIDTPLPEDLENQIREAYARLAGGEDARLAVAVRSSATAEDLPDASFAGQQETYLNVRGIDDVLVAVRKVYASLYNDRAIAYRVHHGFEHAKVALSAGIQHMVRSDLAASGVMFTLDTESGFRDVVFITAAYGLGETVVQGQVNPDEYYVHKPMLARDRRAIIQRSLGTKALKMIYRDNPGTDEPVETVDVPQAERARFALTDDEVLDLARQAVIIEEHYGRPMDIEWAKDGDSGALYIVQARPETVKSRDGGQHLERYILKEKGDILLTGRSIGSRIGAGRARVIADL
ncbi:MAG TPA: PEP/pyruvate-binding domain-containing protein, partial [Gammaproteobacteria bacterium]|nr:PEP/pyruvate-binding domain-containing protein [Gammaproteobacteria bacterium]